MADLTAIPVTFLDFEIATVGDPCELVTTVSVKHDELWLGN